MSRAREEREPRQDELEAALWQSLTAAEQRDWLAFSHAVGRV